MSAGCPVEASTLLQRTPSGSISCAGDTAREMGTWVNWWFQKPHDHVRPAAHACMHGALPELQAEGRVHGVPARHAPDRVARVDILEGLFHAGLLKWSLIRHPSGTFDVSVTSTVPEGVALGVSP